MLWFAGQFGALSKLVWCDSLARFSLPLIWIAKVTISPISKICGIATDFEKLGWILTTQLFSYDIWAKAGWQFVACKPGLTRTSYNIILVMQAVKILKCVNQINWLVKQRACKIWITKKLLVNIGSTAIFGDWQLWQAISIKCTWKLRLLFSKSLASILKYFKIMVSWSFLLNITAYSHFFKQMELNFHCKIRLYLINSMHACKTQIIQILRLYILV